MLREGYLLPTWDNLSIMQQPTEKPLKANNVDDTVSSCSVGIVTKMWLIYSNQECRLITCEKWCKCEQGLFWLLQGPGSEAMKALAFVGICSHTVYHLRRTTWVSSCQIWNASGIQIYIVYIVCQWVHIQYYSLLNWMNLFYR